MRRTSRPTWRQKAGLLLFGLALVGMAEAALRLAGFGGPPLLLLPAYPGAPAAAPEARLFRVNPLWADLFFAATGPAAGTVGGHRAEVVAVPKPAGTLRVVLVGASSVEGFPHPRHLAAASFLEEMLADALPDRPVEVFNLGVTAVASFPVRILAGQALEELAPDALVVYSGHNEFFGARGVASSRSPGHGARALALEWAVRRTALYQVLDRLVRRGSRDDEPTHRNLIEVMAGVPLVQPDGPLHRRATGQLAANLEAIVDAARATGTPLLLATLASNERDLHPVASWGEGEAADDRHAGRVWARARALAAAGDPAAAAAFRRARDLDAMPWRAPAATSEVVRRLAARRDVPLADVERAFAAAAGGPPGWTHFDDHVHPSLRGQALLARTLFHALRDQLPLGLPAAAEPAAGEVLAARLGGDDLEAFVVAHKMATLFQAPPLGTHNREAARRFALLARLLRRRAAPLEAATLRRWEEGSRTAGEGLPIAFVHASVALDAVQPRAALAAAEAAVRAAPPATDEAVAAEVLRLFALAGSRRQEVVAEELPRLRRRAVWLIPPGVEAGALLARGLALLAALAGEADEAAAWEQRSLAARPDASPRELALLAQLPAPDQLATD